MAQYGQMLNDYEPNKDSMYQAFDNYFNHPTMVKVKNVNGHSMYMAKMYCLLSNECRYIIVFVTQDTMLIRAKESLKNLRWISLQTRTLPDHHDLPSHGYQPRREGPLNVVIDRTSKTPKLSTYSCKELPLTCTILHTKQNVNEYQDRGNIIAALETYQTILTLKS